MTNNDSVTWLSGSSPSYSPCTTVEVCLKSLSKETHPLSACPCSVPAPAPRGEAGNGAEMTQGGTERSAGTADIFFVPGIPLVCASACATKSPSEIKFIIWLFSSFSRWSAGRRGCTDRSRVPLMSSSLREGGSVPMLGSRIGQSNKRALLQTSFHL